MADAEHPRDADAVEYVVGTLPAAERRAFEAEMERDAGLLAVVRGWQERLAPLSADIPVVLPPPGLWTRIAQSIDRERMGTEHPRDTATVVPFDVESLRRSRARWRGVAVAISGLAAALAVALGLSEWRTSPARGPVGSSLVAVVNQSGDLPALLVRVDPSTQTVQVRPISAVTPPQRSLELWSISQNSTPRSMGLVDGRTTRIALPTGAGRLSDGVVLAVSVEPAGGSPTGSPTGPVIYSGRLIPDVP